MRRIGAKVLKMVLVVVTGEVASAVSLRDGGCWALPPPGRHLNRPE